MKHFICICLLLLSTSSAFSALTAKVDKKKVGMGDTLTLTLTSDNPRNNTQPDLSIIEQDFNIISSEHQVSYNIIDNVTSAINQWVFVLLPKREGKFKFSPLTMGNETTTAPLNVEVTLSSTITENQPSSQDAPTNDVFIKIIATPKTAFINQQIIYTVRVYSRRHLINIDYTPPQTDNALMIPLAQTQPYQISLHGDIYAVEELQYAIFANQRGTLTITPPQLKGMTYDMLPHPVQTKGALVKIHIQPAPAGSPTPFLPAQSLHISEKFEPTLTSLKQGDTLVRTLEISAEGIPASLLPLPDLKGKNYSVYPTQPILKNHPTKTGIKGIATINATYLFNKEGTHTLPALTIPWYDTVNHTMQTATLPAHNISIDSGDGSISATKNTPPTRLTTPPHLIPIWLSVLLIILVALLLLLITIILYQRDLFKRHATPAPHKKNSLKKIRQQLRQACLASDAKKTQPLLLKWAQLIWPEEEIINLGQISELSQDNELKIEVDKLGANLYRNTHGAWDGSLLWKAIERFKIKEGNGKGEHGLPSLNP